MLDCLCVSCTLAIPWIDHIACDTCGRAIACPDCVRRESASFVRNRSAVRYDAVMRQWLALYKYRGHEKLAQPLAEMLCSAYERMTEEEAWREGAAAAATGAAPSSSGSFFKIWRGGKRSAAPWAAVTFVPVSKEREAERGFNQARHMAETLAARYRLPLHALLTRIRHSGKQSLKSRRERIEDMRTAFGIHAQGAERLREAVLARLEAGEAARILLVDDIYTTGGTVDACAANLLEAAGGRAGVSVHALTWARS